VTTGRAAPHGDIFGLESTTFDDRFRVDRFIAEGGFAVVYKAFQVALDRWVALKVLKSPRGGDEAARREFRDNFANEAKTIAKLRHPHIVDVHDFSVATLPTGDPAPWMALEWLDGQTLARQLRRRRDAGERGLEPAAAVELLRPAIEALAHAHANGIVHRDIKPANMMVLDPPRGGLKVLDFGIAKIVAAEALPSSGHTRTENAPAFSPAYAAPEQVAFSRTGPWTDVHALGLVLSELMTDRPPFDDEGEAHMFEQAMARERPTPARKGRDVGAFEPVIARSLALSPRDRWKDAGELLSALDDAKSGIRSSPAPQRRLPGARRWIVATAATAVGLAAGGGWLAVRRKNSTRLPAPVAHAAPVLPAPPAIAPETAAGRPPQVSAAAELPPQPAPVAPPRAKRPRAVTKQRKERAPAQAPVTDERDLFDDTK
jgi:serine/threonine protein kinase